MNNYSEFQVNIFRNNRDVRKCHCFRKARDDDDDAAAAADDARAMTMHRSFLRKTAELKKSDFLKPIIQSQN